MKILLIEDNLGIKEIVAITIELRWPEANLIHTRLGKKGVELASTEHPDIIILDLGLPDIGGFEVLSQIRGFSDVPVVILTVRGEESDKIRALELGADDYIVKPFSSGELIARLKALLRRSQTGETTTRAAEEPAVKGKLSIDFSSQRASIGDRPLKLSPREYDLLSRLASNKGMVLSKKTLMEEVFPEHGTDTRFLDVYIDRLRKQLEEDPDKPTIIVNEGEAGYKLVD